MSRERIFLSPPHMGGHELELVREAFSSNYIAPVGPQLTEFEHRFAAMTGFAHAVGVSSGTAALHLALRCVGAGPGDAVLLSSLTFIGSATPTLFQGAEPVFIDSERDSWNMDPERLAEALQTLTHEGRRIAAVIPTDIYGQSCDLDAILAVCAPYDIPVICDSAESVGALYRGRHAGKGARAAAYSFNGNKIITTSGGGMLCTDDEGLANEARRLSQQARDDAPCYEHSTYGYSYRLSNILAAIGLAQLDILPERIEGKRKIFQKYVHELSDVPGLSFMPETGWARHTRWLSVILLNENAAAGPETIRQVLETENIESRPVWKPMHMQPVFSGARSFGGCVCESLFRQGLCLPSGTAMTGEDVAMVATIIRECCT